MSTDDIRTRLLDFVRREFKRPALGANDPLLVDAVDSVGVFNLVGFIETTFRVALDDSELTVENFADVETLASLIHARLPATGSPR